MTTLEDRAARTATEVLTWSRSLVDPALHDAVDGLPDTMRRIVGYHFGWHDEQGRPTPGMGGKALRPAMVLLAAEAVGGRAHDAVAAAVAVELVHNFSLLHDDVMDADITRRHRPTAWSVFGVNQAILAGDALLALALEVVSANPRAVRLLAEAVQRLIEGQSTDLAFERRQEVSLPECLRMAQLKTGALLRCSSALGALYGGGDARQVEHLSSFGERVGLAFQVVDDLLGIWGDPAVTGKPVHSDLRSRKKSMPVVAALISENPQGKTLAELYQGTDTPSREELVRMAQLVDDAGGRRWSLVQIDEQLSIALTHLRAAALTEQGAAELDALAQLATRRDF